MWHNWRLRLLFFSVLLLGLMVVTQPVNSQYFYFYFSSILTDVVQLASHTIITVFTSLHLELMVVTQLASHTIIFFFF